MKDAPFVAVLERLSARMSWNSNAFDRGAGTVRRGRGVAIGFKASIAPTTSMAMVNLYSDGSCGVYCSLVDMGQGSDTALAQIAAETLNMDVGEDPRHPPRHRRDALRHGYARLARHLAHGERGEARGRGCAGEDRRARRRARRAGGLEPAGRGAAAPADMACRRATSSASAATCRDYSSPDHDTGQTPNATPFWMLGATGAEVDGRHRDRRDQGHAPRQRRRRRHAGEPAHRRDAALRRRGDAVRLHHDRGDGVPRRPARQPVARRLQDPGPPRRAADGVRGDRRQDRGRALRRQGRRRDWHVRRLARHRQRHRRCGRRRLHALPLRAETLWRALQAKAGFKVDEE